MYLCNKLLDDRHQSELQCQRFLDRFSHSLLTDMTVGVVGPWCIHTYGHNVHGCQIREWAQVSVYGQLCIHIQLLHTYAHEFAQLDECGWTGRRRRVGTTNVYGCVRSCYTAV